MDDLKKGFAAGFGDDETSTPPAPDIVPQTPDVAVEVAPVKTEPSTRVRAAAAAYVAKKRAAAADEPIPQPELVADQPAPTSFGLAAPIEEVTAAALETSAAAPTGFGLAAPIEEVTAAEEEAAAVSVPTAFGLAAPVEELAAAAAEVSTAEATANDDAEAGATGMSADDAAMFEQAVAQARARGGGAPVPATPATSFSVGEIANLFVETSSSAVADDEAAAERAAAESAAKRAAKWEQTLAAGLDDVKLPAVGAVFSSALGQLAANAKNIAQASAAAMEEASAKRAAEESDAAGRKSSGGLFAEANMKRLYSQLDAAIDADDLERAAAIKRRIDELK